MQYSKSEIEQEILSILEGIDIQKYLIENDNWKMSVFFSIIPDEDHLDKNWNRISSTLGATFQIKLKGKENEFEKWNIYIIYICKTPISKELKNRIENDKFSSRKIVEDDFSGDLDNEKATQLIVKHITNTDLVAIVNSTASNIELNYEPIAVDIWGIIPKDELITRNTDKQKELIEQIRTIQNEN